MHHSRHRSRFHRLRAALVGTTALAAMASATAEAQAQRLVVFGDSLADGGFFSTVVPGLSQEAASFTTNPDPVAPEVFATGIGLGVPGIAYAPGGAPTAAGTNFAIGGARVTLPNANGQVPLSITQQADVFLATRSFESGDIVYLQGGGNDFFDFGTPGSGTFGNVAALATAGDELAALAFRLQQAGAPNIVTVNVQTDGSPETAPLDQAFNAAYEAGLAARGVNALFFDNQQLFNEVLFDAVANGGATFGITNVAGVACASGSSLGCTPAQYVTPDANETFALADSVHPAGGLQRIQGQAIAATFNAGAQVGQLAYGTQAVFRSHLTYLPPVAGGGSGDGTSAFAGSDGAPLAVFGGMGYHHFDNDRGGAEDLRQDGPSAFLGLGYRFSDRLTAGVTFAYTDVDGDLSAGGEYAANAYSVALTARGAFDAYVPLRYGLTGLYGRANYDRVARSIALGPAVRVQNGETDGDYFAIDTTVEADATTVAGLAIGPRLGLLYESVKVDAFADSFVGVPLSTDVAFGGTDLDQLTTRIGAFARGNVGAFAFDGHISWNHTFGDDSIAITTTPSGAPISFTRSLGDVDRDYLAFSVNVSGNITRGLEAFAGVSGELFRDDQTLITGKGGLKVSF